MQKWEYMEFLESDGVVKKVNRKYAEDVSIPLFGPLKGKKTLVFLNELGAQGWELVNFETATSGCYYLLKRPIP